MNRADFGVPRSLYRIITWWIASGERLQKSQRRQCGFRCVRGSRFWVRMKSENLIASRTKKIGVLLPTRSQLPSSV
jgi:hypothetical protein